MADKLDETELKGLVASEISSAITYDASELSEKRSDALEYYQGELKDFPAMEGRSSVTSRDLSDTIGWMLPGIIRVFTASDRMAVFEPVRKGDEEFAEQATDFCNYVFWKDNDGYRILYNTTHDSLLHANGVGKIWWDDAEDCEYSDHTRLTEEQLALLTSGKDVEVLAATENEEDDLIEQVDPETGQKVEIPVKTYDVKIKRVNLRGKVAIESLAPEDFLMDKDATEIDKARFTAHRSAKTRSELIEMGFDKETVENLPSDGLNEWREETLARDEDRVDFEGNVDRAEEQVELYECYVRADADGDGVSETLKVYYAGNSGGGEILDWEVCDDENPFFDLPCKPVPHRWDARGIADDTMDIMRIKTALIRGTLDNLYASNLPIPDIEEGSVKNMEALLNPQFGVPIIRKKGSQPINWQDIPFVAGESLQAIDFFDNVIEKRTGVSRGSMALDPEALQNQTATANQNAKDAAYSQIELIARNHAEYGWRCMFRKMLRLIVKHQDRPRTIRLRDEWVDMDPRYWNSNMDVTINTGLGTGSRDRDLAMLNTVKMDQKVLVDYAAQAGFPELALEMLPKVLNSMRKSAESAGMRDVDEFYPDVKPEQIAQMQQAMKQKQSQPDPKIAMEQQKAQADMQIQQMKLQADAQAKQAEQQMKSRQMEQDFALKREQLAAEMGLKREQLVAELQLKKEQMTAEMQLKREMGFVDGFTKANSSISSNVRPGGEPG